MLLEFLLAYSLDLNPIELKFGVLKKAVRRFALDNAAEYDDFS